MASEGVFQQQIKNMMYVFGDVRQPNTDTVLLMEEFTKHQLQELVSHAAKVSSMREGRMVRTEDVVFLLRKDKDQLKRLLHHMEVKTLAKRMRSSESRADDGEFVDESELDEMGGSYHSLKKMKLAHDFLTPLQKATLKLEESDELETQRLQHQDELTSSMSAKEYLEYTERRGTSLHKNMSKFKEWVGVEELTSLRISPDVFDVLGHLARETVRKLVELSLQVKSDMNSKPHIPRQWPSTHASIGQDPTLSIPPSTQPGSSESAGRGPFVLSTPPSSPPANILSSPHTTTDAEPQFAITSSSLRRSSREARKRQRASQPVPSVPEKEPAPAAPTPPRKHTPQALKPLHVREAVRRLSQSHLLTPVTPLWAHQPSAGTLKNQKSWCL